MALVFQSPSLSIKLDRPVAATRYLVYDSNGVAVAAAHYHFTSATLCDLAERTYFQVKTRRRLISDFKAQVTDGVNRNLGIITAPKGALLPSLTIQSSQPSGECFTVVRNERTKLVGIISGSRGPAAESHWPLAPLRLESSMSFSPGYTEYEHLLMLALHMAYTKFVADW